MERILLGKQICMTNDQCTIVHMSDRFLNFLGYTRQDLKEQGNSFYTVIHPDDVAMVCQTITAPKAQQTPICLQYRVQKKNGEIAYLHGEGYFILQNKENHFCCELADITPYDTLLQQYLHIFQSLPNPLMLIDKNLKILSMNKAAEQNFHTTLSACQGKPCSIFNTPLCHTPDCCLKRFERGDSAAVQYGPGEQAFRISFARLYSLKGEQIGYISISTDITELVKIQRELKISEERFRIALSQTRNTIWEYDLATRTIFQSDMLTKATSSIYGLKGIVENIPDSLLQSGSIHQDSAEDLRNLYRDIHLGKKVVQQTIKVNTRTNHQRWVKLLCSTVFDENNKPIKAIGIAQDITDEKNLEQLYRQERQYRDSLIFEAMGAFEVNLTQDMITQINTPWPGMLDVSKTKTYSQWLGEYGTNIHPHYQEYVRNTLGKEALLETYRLGKREIHGEYPLLDAEAQVIWVRSSAYLIASEITGHICAFMYIKNIDQQKKKELELKKNAEEDPLTGLFNRNTTLALINKALKQDNNTLCALFMLDIDNFKHLNDTYGHLYGDAVLSEMAQKLSSIFRKNDIVGRLGGDEFMVFLKHIPDETLAEQKARQICQTLQTTYSSGNQLCEISCSVGFALTPQHGRHFNTLYEKADIALYHAKNQGKNRYSIYCDGMTKINLNLRQPPVPLKKYMGKTFSDNITEYVFKILYHSDDLALSIHAVLELLAKHYDAQHAYVFEYALLHKTYSLRYEWCAQGIAEQKDWMQNLTKEHLDEYWKLFDEDGVYCVEDTRQISSKIVAITKRVGAKAFLQCAIVIGGEFKGFIGVDDCHHPRKATEKERDTMKFVSEIIGIFLNAKHSEQEKEQHSAALQTMMDNLTNAVYVVNPRNHRLIFKNRQGSIESPQAKLGQPCYQGLQGFAAPCPQCPMLHLKQDLQAKETKELYVPSTGKWVHVSISWIHWPDGEHYCMMSCMDITSYKEPRNK